MKPESLESLFHIDRSDPSTGIKISLKKPPEKRHSAELEFDLSGSPMSRFP